MKNKINLLKLLNKVYNDRYHTKDCYPDIDEMFYYFKHSIINQDLNDKRFERLIDRYYNTSKNLSRIGGEKRLMIRNIKRELNIQRKDDSKTRV